MIKFYPDLYITLPHLACYGEAKRLDSAKLFLGEDDIFDFLPYQLGQVFVSVNCMGCLGYVDWNDFYSFLSASS